jgi:hypothetical protein
MSMLGVNLKKLRETAYMEEARRASPIFPRGELVPQEKPDFLLRTESGTIGIEITELCREAPRAEGGRLSKVADGAKAIYNGMANAQTVDVSAAFSEQAESVRSNDLTNSLAEFVYRNRENRGSSFTLTRDLPNGYCDVGIYEPSKRIDPTGHWHAVQVFDGVLVTKELLESRIEEKNQRLREYRLSAPTMWLLIVNDQFLGPGEVYAHPEQLAEWKFAFDFEKVLLFSREPGGTGEVIELQRV